MLTLFVNCQPPTAFVENLEQSGVNGGGADLSFYKCRTEVYDSDDPRATYIAGKQYANGVTLFKSDYDNERKRDRVRGCDAASGSVVWRPRDAHRPPLGTACDGRSHATAGDRLGWRRAALARIVCQ